MKQSSDVGNVRRNVLLIGTAIIGILALGAAGTLLYKFNTSDATIAEGNKAFASQQYDAALEKYTAAQRSAPIFAEPFYNAANVLYKQSKFKEAQPLLEQPLTRSNEKIAEFIQFNLGNISFNAKQFEQAIARYEEALRLNPDDKDAKYNLELALLQKQQQDQQQQQNQDQQNQDQSQEQQQQNQNSQDEQDQQQADQQGRDQQQNPQKQQNGQPQQQRQQQDAQNQQPQKGQPDQNAQQQQNGQGQQGQQSEEQGQEQGSAHKPDELTPEQAKQLLAAVGDNSQTLMEKLQMFFYAPGDEPEKDW